VIIIYILLLLFVINKYYNNILYIPKKIPSKSLYTIRDKKVAILITGQIRDKFKKTLKSIRDYLIYPWGNNVKVFCHFDTNVLDNNKIIINDILSPTDIKYDDINVRIFNEKQNQNTKLGFWRIYECNMQKNIYEQKNNIKFDIVIKIRPDIILYKKIKQIYFDNIEKNTIYSGESDALSNFVTYYKVTDQFAFGDSNSMNVYCNMYNHVDLYINIKCKYTEYILYKYLIDNNILPKQFIYNGIIVRFTNISIIKVIDSFFFDKKAIFLPKYVCDNI
jgi:hypothetical protein